jgi:hypothetical protein
VAEQEDMVQFVGAVASQANTVLHCDGQLHSVYLTTLLND